MLTRCFSSVSAQSSAKMQSLKALTTVRNARDVGESVSVIKPGILYRSGCPVAAGEQDVEILCKKLRIQHLIDLRSEYERKADGPSLLTAAASVKQARRTNDGAVLRDVTPPQTSANEGSDSLPLTVYSIPLLERSRYYRNLMWKLPYSTAASVIFYGIINRSWAKTLAIREVNRLGLPGLYETILDTSGPELCLALKTVTQAAEAGESLMMYCKVGKDRTGLLAALIEASCDASDEDILTDYHRSDGQERVALGDLEKDAELAELDTAMFSAAPVEAMQATLRYVRQTFGSLNGYLEYIGFDGQARSRLAAALAHPPSDSSSDSPSSVSSATRF